MQRPTRIGLFRAVPCEAAGLDRSWRAPRRAWGGVDMSKVFITGAGAGLGRALACSFVADGETVAVLGRTLSKIEDVASQIGSHAIPLLL
jgi:glutamyl-tRNA reductase